MLDVEIASQPHPWSEAQLSEELSHPSSRVVVVETDADDEEAVPRVAGFLVMRVVDDEAEVLNVAVSPNRRGAGLGAALVGWAVETALAAGGASLWLEVRASNATARRLYDRLGFEEVGRRRGYYADNGETAVLLRRPL